MRLTRLEIESLPGLPRGFTLAPGPGVNVVVGPNTSGKSSLVRAVHSLLWPDAVPGAERMRLTAGFDVDKRQLTAMRRLEGVLSWTDGGLPTEPPRLPTAHLRDRYDLGLLDLAERGRGGQAFALEVRRQMTGGYDLDLTGNQLFPRSAAQTTRKTTEWRDADQKCAAFERRDRDLRERERGLDGLRDELAEAATARQLAETLAAALAVHAAREELARLEAALSSFPPAMAAFRPDDPQVLDDARNRVRAAEEEAAAGRRRLDETGRNLATLGAPDPPGAPDPAAVDALVAAWHRAEVARDTAAAVARGARERLGVAMAALAGSPRESEPVVPDRAVIAQLARHFMEAESARARQEAAEALAADPIVNGDAPTGAANEELAALRALDRWLAAPSASRGWPLAAAIAGIVFGLALRTAAAGFLPVALAGLLAAGGALLAVRAAVFARRQSQRADEARTALRAAGITEAVPDRAAAADVRDRRRQEMARRETRDALRTRLLASARHAAEQVARIRADAEPLRQACGLGADLSAAGVLHDAAAVASLREARELATQADGELGERNAEVTRCADRTQRTLAEAGLAAPTDATAAAGVLQAWRVRREARVTLENDQRQQREFLDESERRRVIAAVDLARLRTRLALADDGSRDEELAILSSRHDAWRDAIAARDAARATLAMREGVVEPELVAKTTADLTERLAAARDACEQEPRLRQEIADLNAALKQANEGRDYEQALALRDRRLDDLAEDRATARRAALADVMLADLRRQTAASRPAVLEAAAEHLARFTRGDHRLELLGGAGTEPEFAAVDARSGIRQSLDELSDGTRAQLLLAVRLAFIETLEAGEPLPLFLDEALTTTDGERFDAIAGALGTLARDQKRQIFYLTSQLHDADAWRRALSGRGLAAPCVLDLEQARGLAGRARPEQLPPPAPAGIPRPEPGPDGLAAWRLAVNVPAFDPRREPAAQHVDWLLLDDAGLLYRLEVSRAATVGTALATRVQLIAGGVLDEATADALEARADLLELFCRFWRRGRGRIVTVEDIDASGAITATMRPRVLELLDAVDGDPQAFSAGLDNVRGLREAIVGRLRDHLRDSGTLDESGVLDEAALLHELLGELGHRRAASGTGPPDPQVVRSCVSRWWQAAAIATARG